ncbi:MAG: DNA ligase-associated DEXH box helicase, partial [Paracoccaceae bacterium]
DGEPRGRGPRDVLCQHIQIIACSGTFNANALYKEIITTGDYRTLTRAEFDECLEFVATGGYALQAYDRWQRLVQKDGVWQLRDPRLAAKIRLNIGTIQDTDLLAVRLKNRMGGKPLGEVEEYFASSLTPGDTFLIGGKIVRYESLKEQVVQVTPNPTRKPKVAVFSGTKFSNSTQLSERILRLFQLDGWPDFPRHTAQWLALQAKLSKLPEANRLLVETFPDDGLQYTCVYGFAGRNAMQTLGLLLTQHMEAEGLHPLGFVATDYATLIWGMDQVTNPAPLFEKTILREVFETWLAGNAVMKRTFRASATIAGLIERRSIHAKKSGRQTSFSSDILYDTLCKYDPDHVMLKITREEAMKGLVDFSRIEDMLARTRGSVDHIALDRVSPFAAPLFLEMGRVPVDGQANERILSEAAESMMTATGLG